MSYCLGLVSVTQLFSSLCRPIRDHPCRSAVARIWLVLMADLPIHQKPNRDRSYFLRNRPTV